MSFQDFLAEVKTSSSKNNFYLASGPNFVRIVSSPIKIDQAFCIQKTKDKETGEEKVYKGSEIVYDGCGYEKYSSTSFVVYAIDSNDQRAEDGSVKIKTLQIGWKVLEGLAEQEKSRELQGGGRFSFPMDLDVIISKNGQGQLGTTYGVSVMLSEAYNKVKATKEEINDALSKMPTLKEWKLAEIEATKEKHAKYGIPKAEKQIKEEEAMGKAQAELPTVQLEEGTEFVNQENGDQVSSKDIPF